MNAKKKSNIIKKERIDTSASDQINLRYQDKTYNELFRQWRRNSKDSGGFFYVEKPDELTYRDGYGFVKDYPEAAESSAIGIIYKVLGMAFLILTLSDFLQVIIVPMILNKLGADIYHDFWAGKYYGNEWLITSIKLFFEIFKRILVAFIIYKKLNIPIKVMFPTKIMNKHLFVAAVPVMLMVAALGSLTEALFEIVLHELNISNVSWIQLPKDRGALIYYLIVGVIIAPCCSELFSRGVIMQLMRQFGDGTAVVFSAFITAAACFNLSRFCYMFLVSLVAGYFTIRTGSVITAVIMRITASAFAHGLYLLDEYLDVKYEGMVIMLVILAALLIGIGFSVSFMVKHSDKLGMPLLTRYLTFSQKVTAMFTNVNMVIWLSTVIIMTLFNIRILL